MTWRKTIGRVLTSSDFWTAASTIVIAVFTVELYCVSNRQWQTMQRQLRDSEVAQTASLSIQGLHIENFPQNLRVVFDVTNAGPTRADRITLAIGGGSISPTDELDFFCGKLTQGGLGGAAPNINGFSLSQGDHRHFDEEMGGPLFDPAVRKWREPIPVIGDVLSGKSSVYIDVFASYLDVFGNIASTADCVVFTKGRFVPCVCQHDRHQKGWPPE